MLHCFCPEETTLLEDLLAASENLYHRNVATIQRVFVEQYFETLRGRRARSAVFLEEQLRSYRQALRAKQEEMIREQRDLLIERDRQIRAYVASLNGSHEAAA